MSDLFHKLITSINIINQEDVVLYITIILLGI